MAERLPALFACFGMMSVFWIGWENEENSERITICRWVKLRSSIYNQLISTSCTKDCNFIDWSLFKIKGLISDADHSKRLEKLILNFWIIFSHKLDRKLWLTNIQLQISAQKYFRDFSSIFHSEIIRRRPLCHSQLPPECTFLRDVKKRLRHSTVDVWTFQESSRPHPP